MRKRIGLFLGVAGFVAAGAVAIAQYGDPYFRLSGGGSGTTFLRVQTDAAVYHMRVGIPANRIQPTSNHVVGAPVWDLLQGDMPPGLGIDSRTGEISGTPTLQGEYDLVVRQSDEGGRVYGSTDPFKIIVMPALAGASDTMHYMIRPTVAHTSEQPTMRGETLSFSVDAGDLPSGLALDDATGIVSGVPAAGAGASTAEIRVTDSIDQESGIAVLATYEYAPPIDAGAVPPLRARAGVRFESQPFSFSQQFGEASLSLEQGALPDGFLLEEYNARIVGQSSTVGVYPGLQFRISDMGSHEDYSLATFDVVPGLQIDYGSQSNPVRGIAYASSSPAIDNQIGTISYEIVSGTLPPGLTLGNDGRIVGTASVDTGSYSVTVRATDSYDNSTDQVVVDFDPAPAIDVGTVYDRRGRVGATWSIPSPGFTHSNGAAEWSIAAGTLPAGLALQADGSISGTATTAQTAAGIVLKVKDDVSSDLTAPFSIQVFGQLAFAYDAFEQPILGLPFTTGRPDVDHAIGSMTYSLASGSLPAGVTLKSDGTISGTPTVGEGTFTATIRGRDAFDNSSFDASVTIEPRPDIQIVSGATSHIGRAGSPFETAAPTINHAIGAVSWSLQSGSLPSGIEIDETSGRLHGTTAAVGISSGIVLRVEDTKTSDTTASMSITMMGPLAVSLSPPQPLRGQAYNGGYPNVTNRVGTMTYSITSGALPAGLTMGSDGRIVGTPTVNSGTYPLTIEGTDSYDQAKASVNISLSPVEPAPVYSYGWNWSGWSGCSASCGGGWQSRSVWCQRSDGATRPDAECSASGSKPATTTSCNNHSCPVVYGTTGTASCTIWQNSIQVPPPCYGGCGDHWATDSSTGAVYWCKSSWDYKGKAQPGGCAAGHQIMGWYAGGTSFSCYGPMN